MRDVMRVFKFKRRYRKATVYALYTACLKNVTNLMLNNFNKRERISIIFLLMALVGFFATNHNYNFLLNLL